LPAYLISWQQILWFLKNIERSHYMFEEFQEDLAMNESAFNTTPERLEASEIKVGKKNLKRTYGLVIVLVFVAFIGAGVLSQKGQHILKQSLGLKAVSSHNPIKQVTMEQVQVSPPVVQTEEKITASIASMQPENPEILERILPEEEKESSHPIDVRKRESLEMLEKEREPQPVRADETQIISLVESWRWAWESKRLEEYIAHYHPAFEKDGKELSIWKRYKKKLNERYHSISVEVHDIKVKVKESKAWAYFMQRYRSDSYSDYGPKLIEFRKKDHSWKIYREKSLAKKQVKPVKRKKGETPASSQESSPFSDNTAWYIGVSGSEGTDGIYKISKPRGETIPGDSIIVYGLEKQ
jgi:hypothetical protein